ncbi:MAG: MBL fold metallo-hydrolase [Lachnospiraceae bacterium]|nr:MBL fold metallo-hydrolase [Lachnospiraceae bacterium]
MSSRIHELHYSNTNTYLIEGEHGRLLLDTGWAGTFPAFCRACGEMGIPVQGIDYILITHFHPDHMGIAQEIAELGPVIVVTDVQRDFIHSADDVFRKEPKTPFVPIDESKVRFVSFSESRVFLAELGLQGEILYTPGHSDDSISLCLDDGAVFAGDLNPLYELDMHRGTAIEKSWTNILAKNPKVVYYGHAKAAEFRDKDSKQAPGEEDSDLYPLVAKIMKYIDKGLSTARIERKTGADQAFIENVARMYLTHQNVGVQGILDRIELRGTNR